MISKWKKKFISIIYIISNSTVSSFWKEKRKKKLISIWKQSLISKQGCRKQISKQNLIFSFIDIIKPVDGDRDTNTNNKLNYFTNFWYDINNDQW